MKKTVIAAGHICLDITPVFSTGRALSSPNELLIPGKLIHMEPADVHTGGSVANTGLALKILGNDVKLLGKVGNDEFGSMVGRIAERYGADGLLVDENSSTSYSVVLAMPGLDRIFLHDPGANDSFRNADIPDEALEDCVLFHFGYPPLMAKMYENDGEELVSIFRRLKEKGIATSLDLASVDPESAAGQADWQKILSRVLPYVDFFVPSFDELLFMLDRERSQKLTDFDMDADVVPLTDELLAMGCRAILIKCGTKGVYFRTAGKEKMSSVGERLGLDAEKWADKAGHVPSFRPERVLSATGAGDTCIAAFLTAALMGKGPAESATLAAAEGACAVTSYDALSGLRSIAELEEKIQNGWERS